MNTAEMWSKAQNDMKTYVCINGDVAYSKKHGLTHKNNFDRPWLLSAWDSYQERGLDDLLNCEWEEIDNVMSIEEAEKKFGIRITRY